MTCAEFRDRVDELVDGLLPPEESGRFDGHSDECSECAGRREEAASFAELLDSKGRDSLEAWEAARLTLHAVEWVPPTKETKPSKKQPVAVERPAVSPVTGSPVTVSPLAVTPLAVTPLVGLRRWRLVAAAVLVAAVGFVASGIFGGEGPIVLAEGNPADLELGVEATSGQGWTLVAESQGTLVTLVARSDGRELELGRGVAQFRVEPGTEFSVRTPHGAVTGHSAVFFVDVRGDGAVAVNVVSGRVEYGSLDPLYQGERLEIASSGRVARVSAAQLQQAEIECDMRDREIADLRQKVDLLEDQAVALSDSAARNASATSEITTFDPVRLGAASFVLLDRNVAWDSTAKLEAKEMLYGSARLIRDRYGVIEMTGAIGHPQFLADVAPGFLGAIAPEADALSVQRAVNGVVDAMSSVTAAMDANPTPTELGASRQRAILSVLRSVETHLGADSAARVVHVLPREWRQLRPWQMVLNSRTESSMVTLWKNRFDVDAVQESQLRILVKTYIAEALTAQGEVAATLPPAEVNAVLVPNDEQWRNRIGRGRRPGFPRGAGGSGVTDSEDHERREPELPAIGPSERVAKMFREMDARLRLAEPRMRFERSVWTILRLDQRERGFHAFSSVITFRPAEDE